MSKPFARAAFGAFAILFAGCTGAPEPRHAASTSSTGSMTGSTSGSGSGGGTSASASSSTGGSSATSSSTGGSSASSASSSASSSTAGSTGGTSASASSSSGSGSTSSSSGSAGSTGSTGAGQPAAKPYIFTIALENEARSDIYASSSAPYINGTLMVQYAHAGNYQDVLPLGIESGPHYVWMEAGTNAFADHSFTTDDDPSRSNSTSSTAHLVTQVEDAGLTWRVYMEGIDGSSGACPLNSNGTFAAWHNPVIWFRDVVGDPPSTSNAYCVAHHRNYGNRFADDLHAGDVANYTFITPNLCHDMHGEASCGNSNDIRAGDNWLAQNLPPIIDFVNAHGGVIFLIWDETSATNQWGDPIMPFLVIGPNIKPGFESSQVESHSSYLKTVEELLGVPALPTVQAANDLSNYWQPGTYPARP